MVTLKRLSSNAPLHYTFEALGGNTCINHLKSAAEKGKLPMWKNLEEAREYVEVGSKVDFYGGGEIIEMAKIGDKKLVFLLEGGDYVFLQYFDGKADYEVYCSFPQGCDGADDTTFFSSLRHRVQFSLTNGCGIWQFSDLLVTPFRGKRKK